jgi:6-bladed beta-propeller protein
MSRTLPSTTAKTLAGLKPRRLDSASPSSPAWTWVYDANGRRYLSDEFNHRIVVEEPNGRVWSFGQRGSGAGEFRFPRGLALVQGTTQDSTRLYVVDTWNHRIQVFDGRGRFVVAFGGPGSGPGQFRTPADLVIAQPETPWGLDRGESTEPVLIVADEWNARVQILELDGSWLATVGGRGSMLPRDPSRLLWENPFLVVTGGNGRTHRLNLASAMPPSFDDWQAQAIAA